MDDKQDLNEFEGVQRLGVFFLNWLIFLAAPIWAPIAFWGFAISGKGFMRKLLTGRKLISE